MPVGDNSGGQLNLLMFEVGMITRDPAGLIPDIVTPVALHPLVVAPTEIRYTDKSRGGVVETAASALRSIAGRALLEMTLSGTWGVESRGLGPIIGTGDLRFKRFWHEVVRLSSATNKEQVDAEKDLFRSPFLNLALLPYDEERSSFFVNFYDFWHNVQFELEPSTFTFKKGARGGGATGLTHYTFTAQEAGPIVVGGITGNLLNSLFQALTAWDSVNELLKSYTLQAVIDSFGAVGGILTSQVSETLTAAQDVFVRDIDPATGLVNGFVAGAGPPPISVNADGEQEVADLSGFLANAGDLALSALDLADTLDQLSPSQQGRDNGEVDWRGARGEGQLDSVEAGEEVDALHSLADAAAFQKSAGALYGMSREEYAQYLSSTGRAGRGARISGSVPHVVRHYDTPTSIEAQYGVGFDVVLRVNRLLASEALIPDTVLQIPRERVTGAQSYIDGLPTFGSHTGEAAWGRDLYADLQVNTDGGLGFLEGPDVLVQGISWLTQQFGEEIMDFVNDVPDLMDARTTATRTRIAALLATDRRIAAVDAVDVTNDAGVLDVDITVTAINGGTISTTRT